MNIKYKDRNRSRGTDSLGIGGGILQYGFDTGAQGRPVKAAECMTTTSLLHRLGEQPFQSFALLGRMPSVRGI